MDLAAMVRKGVAIANQQTASLQVTVMVTPVTGRDVFNAPAYGDEFSIQAIVDKTQRTIRGRDGEQMISPVSVTFLEPIALDLDMKIVLPDSGGTVARIEAIESGLLDPETDAGYFGTVRLG